MEFLEIFWELGGPFLWLLLILGCIGCFVFVERLLFLHRSTIRKEEFLSGILNLVSKGRILEALTVCEENKAPLSRMIRAGLLAIESPGSECVERMREAAWLQMPLLEKRVGSLRWIARIAPLTGLLGTLLPMTTAFLQMRNAGPFPGNDFLFGLLGQAMVTTSLGFIVALVAFSAMLLLQSRLDRLVYDLESGAAEFLAAVEAAKRGRSFDNAE